MSGDKTITSENDTYSSDHPQVSDENLLTVSEVSTYLKVKPETVRALARTKKIPAVKVGKSWRFSKARIEEFLKIK